ncbi:hypothetical protein [uncultured Arthrobacter sp.]|uniref:hypothetical protein n=1 Tax=uncultured Arthrobacter sp. TaxID=114050 RepID=UPI002622DE1A|nr:hypothetical protein [uncultured Arthrobacter sp.]
MTFGIITTAEADAICERCPFFTEGTEADVRDAAEGHMADNAGHWARLTLN